MSQKLEEQKQMLVFSFLLGIPSFFFYKYCSKKIKEKQKQLKNYKSQKVLSIQQLLQEAQNQLTDEKKQELNQKNQSQFSIGTYFVGGEMCWPSKIINSYDNSKQLIFSQLKVFKYFIRKQQNVEYKYLPLNNNNRNTIQNEVNCVDSFFLQDKQNQENKVLVKVEDFQQAGKLGLVRQLYNKKKIRQQKEYQYDLDRAKDGSEIIIGFSREETGILFGGNVMVYGEAYYDVQKDQISFKNPKYLMRNKNDLLNDIKTSNFLFKLLRGFCGFMVFFGVYNIFHFFNFSWQGMDLNNNDINIVLNYNQTFEKECA
ncbi:hypothetical protein PPERSA_05335 [Pseudocohnilembus persalinus]|uniref:Transmembrane protein n=1 Tax=Pseudocohnilembus persalinus TaxID=266149 RepID=A0A0V0R644_PSEPJ|nr:hypothetical protein PPERSA_05335 [Pseudocohnilembus persalinus]|eukprot:KRX09943.1 hypothetical protein PPERSA_05335 [Pseudocohnilembus persalinus]